jgi:hypothetical protein
MFPICIPFAFYSIYFLHAFLISLPDMLSSSVPHSFELPHYVDSFILSLTKFSFSYANSLHILCHFHWLTDETMNKNEQLKLHTYFLHNFVCIEWCYCNIYVLIRGCFLQMQESIMIKILKRTCNALQIIFNNCSK